MNVFQINPTVRIESEFTSKFALENALDKAQRLQLAAVREVDGSYEVCEEYLAEMYSLYYYNDEGFAVCFLDCGTYETAIETAIQITEKHHIDILEDTVRFHASVMAL